MELHIEPARPEQAADILELQYLCFQAEADLYGGLPIPPLTQTLQDLQKEMQVQRVLVGELEGKVVGSVRAYQNLDSCCIGRLMVHPTVQGQGLGTQLMGAIERAFEGVKRFELFTGHLSTLNLHLYQKLGYREFKRVKMGPTLELVYLEKWAQQS